MQLLYIEPDRIERDPAGVREENGDISGLADTIRDQGLLQPLGVVPTGRDRFRVVYGGRRLQAAQEIGLERIPCVVLDPEDPDLLLRQLVENVQRRDLNDIEKARGFLRLRERLIERDGPLAEGELDERIGRAAGIAPRTVRRYLGLLDLPEEIQQMIRNEELSVTQAQHLRRINVARTQLELARMAADEGLSAAEVSRLANYFAANPNLTVDTALQALQTGAELRTDLPAGPLPSADAGIGIRETPPALDGDADLWADEPADPVDQEEQRFARLEAGDPVARNKARVFRIRSLDHMVDETDRLARTVHEGELQRWVQDDDTAPFKLRLLLKQLQALSQALQTLARDQGWALDGQDD